MKRVYKLENLECANCAAKMERGIAKLDGVTSASVSFMTARLTIEADGANFGEILDAAQKICSSVEKNCRIVR